VTNLNQEATPAAEVVSNAVLPTTTPVETATP
jgi:hypothetical protein